MRGTLGGGVTGGVGGRNRFGDVVVDAVVVVVAVVVEDDVGGGGYGCDDDVDDAKDD